MSSSLPASLTSQLWQLRLANEGDVPELEVLINESVRKLQAPHYSIEQREAALGTAFGVDRQLIRDGTYFVMEEPATKKVIGCGGWSWRQKIYGADGHQGGSETLDPARDPARVRAFFVHPAWARRGIGRRLLEACEEAIWAAGFRRAELVATLTGEPLYRAMGYEVILREDAPLPGQEVIRLPVVRMGKNLAPSASSG